MLIHSTTELSRDATLLLRMPTIWKVISGWFNPRGIIVKSFPLFISWCSGAIGEKVGLTPSLLVRKVEPNLVEESLLL
jgi:hypothetical protein